MKDTEDPETLLRKGGVYIRVAHVSCCEVLLERATRNLLRHFRWCFANSACEASLEDAVFFFFGRERIADPMCLSPLTVRRGEGEFPLVGVHRIC